MARCPLSSNRLLRADSDDKAGELRRELAYSKMLLGVGRLPWGAEKTPETMMRPNNIFGLKPPTLLMSFWSKSCPHLSIYGTKKIRTTLGGQCGSWLSNIKKMKRKSMVVYGNGRPCGHHCRQTAVAFSGVVFARHVHFVVRHRARPYHQASCL